MFSQYNEDEVIDDFFGLKFQGTFLDIGAGNGRNNSNTRHLSLRGWKGWLVEPHPTSFAELLKEYEAENNKTIGLVHAAMSDHGKPVRFYTGKEPQLSTACHDTLKLEGMRRWLVQSFFIPTLTWSDLMVIIGNDEFDFVSLDCEGMDMDILKASGDILKKVKLLCYETNMPGCEPDADYDARWAVVLNELGFTKVVGKTVGNTFVTR